MRTRHFPNQTMGTQQTQLAGHRRGLTAARGWVSAAAEQLLAQLAVAEAVQQA
ncbi:MAG: hypothetical protein ABIG44_16395 [Planctomycetota bacterium]